MQEAITEFLEQTFVGPVWPASIMVCLLVMYTLVALFGLIDLDLDAGEVDLDVDLDVDVSGELASPDLDGVDLDVSGADAEIGDVAEAGAFDFLEGMAVQTIRWTNFGRVPIVIWAGVFTVVFWTISYGLWHHYDSSSYAPTLVPSVLLSIRNAVLAIVITKYLTQPVAGKFTPKPVYDTGQILGSTCEISSYVASQTGGQAKFRTDTAPLLLNVRTQGPEIPKGTEVRIIDFDPVKRIYTVSEISPEKQS